MSIKAMNWAWDHRLSPSSKLILMALADAADEVGQCWPRVRLIAEKSCTSERTVQRALKELMEKGLLCIKRNYRKDGGQSTNVYQLCLSAPPVDLSPGPDELTPEGDATGIPPGDIALSPHKPPDITISESPPQLPGTTTHLPSTTSSLSGDEKLSLSALIWPNRLTEVEQHAITRMLRGLDTDLAQSLLDELAGVMATKSIKTSPERWFRAVVERFWAGAFVPSAGVVVQEKRRRAQAHSTNSRSRPASPESIARHLEQIHAVLRKNSRCDD